MPRKPSIRANGEKARLAKSEDVSRLAISLGGSSSRLLMSNVIMKKCPDGTPYTILKHPEKAFQMIATDWDATIGVTADRLKGLAAKLGVDLKKRVVKLYENLDNISGDLAQGYNANYLAYSTRPCDKESAETLRKANEKVQHATVILRMIKFEAESSKPDLKRLEELQSQLLKVFETTS
jgi:hypothetical protein